jgi:hypothetical protein
MTAWGNADCGLPTLDFGADFLKIPLANPA